MSKWLVKWVIFWVIIIIAIMMAIIGINRIGHYVYTERGNLKEIEELKDSIDNLRVKVSHYENLIKEINSQRVELQGQIILLRKDYEKKNHYIDISDVDSNIELLSSNLSKEIGDERGYVDLYYGRPDKDNQ